MRLCGILHAADGIATGLGWTVERICADVVRRAAKFCRGYAVPHALAAFDLMGTSETVVNARAVLKWMKSRPELGSDFSKRDAFSGCRGTFGNVEQMGPALALLEQHFVIRPKNQGVHAGLGRKVA